MITQAQLQLKIGIESKLWRLKQNNIWSTKGSSRRERNEIIAEILLFCEHPKKKTKIMYNTNLSYPQLQNYLNCLTSTGTIQQEKGCYVTTERGYPFLELFAELQEIIYGEKI